MASQGEGGSASVLARTSRGGEEPVVITLSGVPMVELIGGRKQFLTDMVITGLAEEILTYRQMPAEALNADIVLAVQLALDLFLDTLVTGVLPNEEAWQELSESAARRAEEGIPLAAVIAAYHTATRLIMEDLVQFCGPDDAPQIMAGSVLAMRYLTSASEVVAARYLEERVAINDVDADLSADRLRRLLDGSPARGDAAPGYLVVSFAMDAHPDEALDGIGAEIAARRKVRRLRRRLSQEGDDTLGTVTAEGGLAVVVVRDGDLRAAQERLPALVARLETASGVGLHAGVAVVTDVARVTTGVGVSRELLDLVVRLGRPHGVYRVEDVAVEYQMTRPGAARALLADTVAPLAGRPELLETLRVFLRTGQDRRATAARLHVHPNTVDYRLNRVTEAIGLEATDNRNAVTLVGAMLAWGAEQREAASES